MRFFLQLMLMALTLCVAGEAQNLKNPHIGYLYPSGGQHPSGTKRRAWEQAEKREEDGPELEAAQSRRPQDSGRSRRQAAPPRAEPVHYLWNGTTAAGTPLGHGMYFVRMETPRGSVAKKLLVY